MKQTWDKPVQLGPAATDGAAAYPTNREMTIASAASPERRNAGHLDDAATALTLRSPSSDQAHLVRDAETIKPAR